MTARNQASRFALAMPPKVKKDLRKAAADDRRSMNDVIVIFIEEGLARRKVGA